MNALLALRLLTIEVPLAVMIIVAYIIPVHRDVQALRAEVGDMLHAFSLDSTDQIRELLGDLLPEILDEWERTQ
jgi:hypothetical protein